MGETGHPTLCLKGRRCLTGRWLARSSPPPPRQGLGQPVCVGAARTTLGTSATLRSRTLPCRQDLAAPEMGPSGASTGPGSGSRPSPHKAQSFLHGDAGRPFTPRGRIVRQHGAAPSLPFRGRPGPLQVAGGHWCKHETLCKYASYTGRHGVPGEVAVLSWLEPVDLRGRWDVQKPPLRKWACGASTCRRNAVSTPQVLSR